jgi:epoxyqueuosine reductase
MKLSTRIQDTIKPLMMQSVLDFMQRREQCIVAMPGAIRGSERSPHRFNIIAQSIQSTGDHALMPGFPRTIPFVASSMKHILRSIHDLKQNPAQGRTTISDELLAELQTFARSVGVDEVGFTTVPQDWVFQETAVRYGNAIMLVMEMDYDKMNAAPSQDTAVMVHETYALLGQASNKIADWLRAHGYAAHAGHPLNGMALYPPLAQKAGLGWRGINGLLITPRFGPRVRLAAVFTEIENLPFYEGADHAWVEDYCHLCQRCIRECPADAIYETPIYHDNQTVTTIDGDKCFPYFLENHGCSVCIKVCPFHSTGYAKLKQRLAHHQQADPIPAR